MQAQRKLNNNTVVCVDESGRQIVAMGKGIGFGTLPRELTLKEIERTFYDLDQESLNVMQDLPPDIVMFSAKMMDIISNELPYTLGPNAALLLADHLAFAAERVKKRIHVQMPLAYDVQQMYPLEYKIGAYVITRMRKELHVALPAEEAVGVAMNLLNAKVGSEAKAAQDDAERFSEMLEEITEIVENDLHIIVDRNSFNFSRYATHLQYLFQRISKHSAIDSENIRLYESLREEFADIARCVEHIGAHIQQKWHCTLSEEEKLYLILHVNRICVKEGL